jgi:hypothetical protein
VHPAVFLAGAALLCGFMLWLRQVPPLETRAAPSVGGRPARERHTEMALGTAALERYVGFHEFDATMRIELLLENGRLILRTADLAPLELLPESDTEFFVKDIDIEVAFELDAANEVTGLVARLANGDVSADRVSEENRAAP